MARKTTKGKNEEKAAEYAAWAIRIVRGVRVGKSGTDGVQYAKGMVPNFLSIEAKLPGNEKRTPNSRILCRQNYTGCCDLLI